MSIEAIKQALDNALIEVLSSSSNASQSVNDACAVIELRVKQAIAEAGKQEPVASEAKGTIMLAAYDFRDAHLSGSFNLKRSAHDALEREVEAALKVTPPQRQPLTGWQPIETAPFNTQVLTYNNGRTCENYRSHQYQNSWTHWMPLPTPPIEASHGIKGAA